jgi:UDP-glucose-4-epimerase GalE
MTHILVTGGAGFIGSHTCKQLFQMGYTPVVLDNLSTGYKDFVKWGPLVQADISDTQVVVDTIRQYNITAMIHFAGSIVVPDSVRDPLKYYDNNVSKSISLIQTAVDKGIRSIVFSSSAAVYGMPDVPRIAVTTPLNPISPYGYTKSVIERLLSDISVAHPEVRTLSLRYFNAAGSDPDGDVGESHLPETHLIPLALDAMSGKRDALTVFGRDYPTPDGTCIRDYIHVMDLAMAHVQGVRYLAGGGESRILNLGIGQGFSVQEVIQTIEETCGQKVPFEWGPRRAGDPARLVADADESRRVLDWTPDHTSLAKIVADAWQWRKPA